MQKKINWITTVLFLCFLFGFAIAFWIAPDIGFSEQENRSLQTLPRFSADRLFNGTYADQINDYYADQFPIRDTLVGLKGYAEVAIGKGENNGILLGKDGQLAKRLFDVCLADGRIARDLDSFDREHLKDAAEHLTQTAKRLEVPFTVLLTPRTIDVAASAFDYPQENSDALFESLNAYIGADVQCVSMLPLFRERYQSGEYVYYKTDHHWTTLGAYYAYAEFMKSVGKEGEILPMDAFEKQTVSDSFYGTAWSAGGMKFVSPDQIEFWLYGNENDFTVIADGKRLDGFYSPSYLEKKDQYSAFLDGTHDVVTVTKNNGGDRPTLLILKDSFANSATPFLAQHFDLVLLNLSSFRTDFTNVSALAAEYQADHVLLLYTVENIVGTDKVNRFQ